MARMVNFIFFLFFMCTGIFLLMIPQAASLTDAANVISVIFGILHILLSLVVLFFVKVNPLKEEVEDENQDDM